MSRADHIAFVSPRFPEGPTVGGAETLLRHLAKIIADSGRKVTFLTTCARNHFTWENELPAGNKMIDGINVHFFPVDGDRDIAAFLGAQGRISRGSKITPADETTWLDNNIKSRALLKHLTDNASTYSRVVMGPYLFGLIQKSAAIIPEKTVLVPCLHDEPFAYLRAFSKMFNNAGGIMFNTQPECELAQRLYGVKKTRSTIVGIDIAPFYADPKRFAASRGIKTRYIIYSGRRESMKGTPLLVDYIEAFRIRTGLDIKLVLTGTGVIDIPSRMAPHVIDVGFLNDQDKHDAMAGAVAFCHASIYESLGIVLLEAWMAGTPCLVHSCSPVLKWQCQKSNGGLWFRNYPEFEEELLMLLNNEPLRRQLAQRGRSYVNNEYSRSAITKRMLDFLDAD